MKRLLLGWCALWCVLLAGSCKYDDADLWSSVDDLNGRVAALENASRQAQSDIAALQTLAQKMYERVSVASVLTNEDGSYTIAFTDGAKVTISNGTDGITPPSLAVTEVDGVCYWVLVAADGTQSFLLDKAGQRVQANGREGRSPQVRINADSGEWEISTDEGATWTSTGVKARGEDGDAYFTDVRIEGGYVVFTLAAGGELRLLRELDLKIVFVVEGEQEFSFGERRVLPMEISGAERFSISKPDGWRAQLTGEGLAVTAPAEENVWAETEGTISVVGFASTGQGAVAEIAVSAGLAMPDTYENLSAGGTANCYVVGAAGGYSLDATVMGNGAAGATFGGVTFADFKATLAPVSARVVWMTEKSLVRSLSIENGRLKFVVPEPFRAGNALIAACDAEGGILWSWHIWLTDADLGASLQTYGDGFVLMDRNLGALAGRPTGEADVETFGLYYQWGRKDPFVGPDKVYTSSPSVSATNTCRRKLFDGSGNEIDPFNDFPIAVATGDGTIGSVAYATAHPETFIKGKNATDWYDGAGATADDRNNALWGNPDGAWRKDVLALRWEETLSGTTQYLRSETIVTRRDGAGEFFSYPYDTTDPEQGVYSYASPVTPQYETGGKSIYDPCPAGYRLPSSGVWGGYNAGSAANEAAYASYLRSAWDATSWGRTFTLPDGSAAWWPAGGNLDPSSNKFTSYNLGKYWASDVTPLGTTMIQTNAENTKLNDGYYYRRKPDDPLGDTKAMQFSFGATTVAANSSFLPPLTTVNGEVKPALNQAPKIGAQSLGSGGSSRASGCNVRCMKE